MKLFDKIKPVPKFVEQGDKSIILGMLGSADFKITTKRLAGSLSYFALDLLYEKLSKRMNACAKCADGSVRIELEISDDVPATVEKNVDQAYKIEAKGSEIKLTGFGEAGLYYAVITFLQCVEISDNMVSVPEFSLLDWPDMKTRGHFMECRYGSNLMELEDWKALVDDMVEMKLNQLVVALYGCWCVQYDGIISEYLFIPVERYPELSVGVVKKYYSPTKGEWINETVPAPMAKKDYFGELVAYGKKRGVEIVPLWNSYGHNTLVPREIPSISAKNEKGELTAQSFCVSNPETYRFFFSVFDEIISKYLAPNGIESFHIGLDEVRDDIATDVNDVYKINSPWCQCAECAKLSNEDKFINHAIKLIKHLKSRGMKNVYIYSDMLTKIVNPKKFRDILKENDILDVTVVDWWTYTNNKERMMFDTMHPELGIRSTVKPWNSYYHWDMTFNAVPNVRNLCELADKEQSAEGLQSYSAWDKVCDKNHVSMADYSWNFKGTGSVEEFNERYAFREFGSRGQEAKHALSLMDQITKEGLDYNNQSDIVVGKSMSNVALLRSLTYYRYSYVQTGKPYPRNFPGEPFELVFSEREIYSKQLSEIADMARTAEGIFTELANDASCNSSLAARFACEAGNYLCVAEDYLALLDIHSLMESEERNCDISNKIAHIANERKNARISLMLMFERTKEHFLIPSHLRNQSIFMQLFADIEAYAKKTPPEDLNLNVFDLRGIGSKSFYSLR